jgi:hypothetical protein
MIALVVVISTALFVLAGIIASAVSLIVNIRKKKSVKMPLIFLCSLLLAILLIVCLAYAIHPRSYPIDI